jgi:hypothetical protein
MYIKRSIKCGVEYRNDIPNTNNGPYFVVKNSRCY